MYKKEEPVVLAEDMPGGAYRKAIYQCIQDTIKRDLTPAEHKYLSGILKLYVDAHVKRITINNTPNEHPTKTNHRTELLKRKV